MKRRSVVCAAILAAAPAAAGPGRVDAREQLVQAGERGQVRSRRLLGDHWGRVS